jgi:hypothetical protein
MSEAEVTPEGPRCRGNVQSRADDESLRDRSVDQAALRAVDCLSSVRGEDGYTWVAAVELVRSCGRTIRATIWRQGRGRVRSGEDEMGGKVFLRPKNESETRECGISRRLSSEGAGMAAVRPTRVTWYHVLVSLLAYFATE